MNTRQKKAFDCSIYASLHGKLCAVNEKSRNCLAIHDNMAGEFCKLIQFICLPQLGSFPNQLGVRWGVAFANLRLGDR